MKQQRATVPAAGGLRLHRGEGTNPRDATLRGGLPASATTGETSEDANQRAKRRRAPHLAMVVDAIETMTEDATSMPAVDTAGTTMLATAAERRDKAIASEAQRGMRGQEDTVPSGRAAIILQATVVLMNALDSWR
jgi:hypothetical protein